MQHDRGISGMYFNRGLAETIRERRSCVSWAACCVLCTGQPRLWGAQGQKREHVLLFNPVTEKLQTFS